MGRALVPPGTARYRRRDVLRASFAVGATWLIGCGKDAESANEHAARGGAAEDISPTEDLMREHGLLNRMMLVYDECARRLEAQVDLRADVVPSTARLVRTFIGDYHEKLEEEHLFPRFERALTHVDLVRTLREQHIVGRKLTALIEQTTSGSAALKKDDRKKLAGYLRAFNRMYRPHEAREDTVLFPDFRALVSASELDELGEQFEKRERALFGENGFERNVTEIDQIEMALDMHDLGQLTPGAPELR
jgi:hemerythrin-like domain-containing protein